MPNRKMEYSQSFDFFVPPEYRGKTTKIPTIKGGSDLTLNIPAMAAYLDVNCLEHGEEFDGCQDYSDRQQLIYRDGAGVCIDLQDVEDDVNTGDLMYSLGLVFRQEY